MFATSCGFFSGPWSPGVIKCLCLECAFGNLLCSDRKVEANCSYQVHRFFYMMRVYGLNDPSTETFRAFSQALFSFVALFSSPILITPESFLGGTQLIESICEFVLVVGVGGLRRTKINPTESLHRLGHQIPAISNISELLDTPVVFAHKL